MTTKQYPGDAYLDERRLGVDIDASTGDLVADGRKDLKRVSGLANVVGAFARELRTPYGYLGRFARSRQQLVVLDGFYGNPLFSQLSEPVTNEWMSAAEDYIKAVADGQPRIGLLGVEASLQPTVPLAVQFPIRFAVGDSVVNAVLSTATRAGGASPGVQVDVLSVTER